MGLQIFYDRLRKKTEGYIQGKRKFEEFSDSCLLYLTFGLKKPKRNEIMKTSAVDKSELGIRDLKQLEDSGFIREIEDSGEFEITANGIWEIEKDSGITSSDMVNCIESERFTFNIAKPLDDKAKVIVFSMVCGRSFSDENKVDMMNLDLSENWKTVLDISFQKLKLWGAVKESQKQWESTLNNTKRPESPLSHLFQHTDKVSRRINNILQKTGNRAYYLDIADGEDVDIGKIAYLFKKIFGEAMDLTNLDEITDHCKEVFVKNGNFLYEDGSKFSHPKYDLSLKEAAEKVIFSL